MAERPKIEYDIHDLLDEANAMLLIGIVNAEKAMNLVARLRHCADQAKEAGYVNSEERLRKAANGLERRLSTNST